MSYKCEHGKDSDVCVQCWEEKNLEPKTMNKPDFGPQIPGWSDASMGFKPPTTHSNPPPQNPKTLDEVCDKPTGTFKEFVKSQDSLTALQNDIQRVTRKLALGQQVFMGDLENILSAAKQLSALQTENSEMSIELGENAKSILALQTENEGLKENVSHSTDLIGTLSIQREELQKKNEQLGAKLEQFKSNLVAIRNSIDPNI